MGRVLDVWGNMCNDHRLGKLGALEIKDGLSKMLDLEGSSHDMTCLEKESQSIGTIGYMNKGFILIHRLGSCAHAILKIGQTGVVLYVTNKLQGLYRSGY